MINLKKITIGLIAILIMSACNSEVNSYDASGSFEAEETIISAEATGTIKALDIEDGQMLQSGTTIGYIDTMQLYLKKKQLYAQMSSIKSRLPDIEAQTGYFDQQLDLNRIRLNGLLNEKSRLTKLVAGDGATTKQLDDIAVQIAEIQKQMDLITKQKKAQASILQTQMTGLTSDQLPLSLQIEQIDDQIAKSIITNPINGTVLTKYAKQNEMTTIGKALYKVADMSTIILRVYISGNQLPEIKINQKVKVFTDDGKGGFKETEGIITWINEKAEFTPKTIQTKDERANMVYATKIKVVNDGSFKIGMYGEIKFK